MKKLISSIIFLLIEGTCLAGFRINPITGRPDLVGSGSSGGSGYALEPATVTPNFQYGAAFSTATFASGVLRVDETGQLLSTFSGGLFTSDAPINIQSAFQNGLAGYYEDTSAYPGGAITSQYYVRNSLANLQGSKFTVSNGGTLQKIFLGSISSNYGFQFNTNNAETLSQFLLLGPTDGIGLVFDTSSNDGTITWTSNSSSFTVNKPFQFESTMTLSGGYTVQNVAPSVGQVLKFDGTNWAPGTDSTGGGGASSLEVFSNFDIASSSPTGSIATGDSLKMVINSSTPTISIDPGFSNAWTSSQAFAGTIGISSNVVVTETGTASALKLIANGTYGTSVGTSGGLLVDGTGGAGGMGMLVQFYTNAGAQVALGGVVNIITPNVFWNEPGLYILDSSSASGHPQIRIDAPNVNIEMINSNLGGTVKYEFAIPTLGDYLQVTRRKADNTSFEDFVRFHGRGGNGTNGNLGFNAVQLMATGYLILNDADDSNYVGLRSSNTVASNLLFVLPAADGGANTVLQTDGSKNWFFAPVSSLSVSGVTAGSYTNANITVSAQGLITLASNGSAGSGSSIYNATATAGFPFGLTASTAVFSDTVTTNGYMDVKSTANFSFGNMQLSNGATIQLMGSSDFIDAGNGQFRLSTGTNPTIDTVGKAAVDKSSGQFVFHDGTNAVVVSATQSVSVSIDTPTVNRNLFFLKPPYDITVSKIVCVSSAATSATIQVQECDANGANCTNINTAAACTTTDTNLALTDTAVTAMNRMRIRVTAVSGSPLATSVDMYYLETRK